MALVENIQREDLDPIAFHSVRRKHKALAGRDKGLGLQFLV